jgi:predicted transcriptional regulator
LEKYGFIVLNFEKFWKRLCSQNRAGKINHAFVRRGVMGPKNTEKLFFYVTHPQKNIQGYADFVERVTGTPQDLWQSLGHESLLNSYKEYQNFLQGRKKVTFVRFKNLKEFPKPVTAEAWKHIIGKKRMPQIGTYLTEKTAHQLLSEGGVKT